MNESKQLPLLEEDTQDRVPVLRTYRCPRCGDETLSEIRLSWIRCPRCEKWYAAREDQN